MLNAGGGWHEMNNGGPLDYHQEFGVAGFHLTDW